MKARYFLKILLLTLGFLSVIHAADMHQIDPGETEVFTGHVPCFRVTHDSSITKSYFVGAKTAAEYQSFYDEVSAYNLPALNPSACP